MRTHNYGFGIFVVPSNDGTNPAKYRLLAGTGDGSTVSSFSTTDATEFTILNTAIDGAVDTQYLYINGALEDSDANTNVLGYQQVMR